MIKMIQKNMNKKGFTLVELIIVIAVMAILAAIVVPRMGNITETFRVKADTRSCEAIAQEIELKIQLGTITHGTTLAANVITTANGLVTTIVPTISDDPTSAGMDKYYASYNASTGILKVFASDSGTIAEGTIIETITEVYLAQ